MAKLPNTSQTAIAITFLVMNLSALLRQVFCLFLCFQLSPHLWGKLTIIKADSWESCQQQYLIITSTLHN